MLRERTLISTNTLLLNKNCWETYEWNHLEFMPSVNCRFYKLWHKQYFFMNKHVFLVLSCLTYTVTHSNTHTHTNTHTACVKGSWWFRKERERRIYPEPAKLSALLSSYERDNKSRHLALPWHYSWLETEGSLGKRE